MVSKLKSEKLLVRIVVKVSFGRQRLFIEGEVAAGKITFSSGVNNFVGKAMSAV
jgi:hypothetical protein